MSKRLQPILDRLAKGETIYGYCESGNSMTPLISHREPVDLSPVDTSKLEVDDIVLAKVAGRFYMHKITAIKDGRVQIGNNHGHINGTTSLNKVYAIVSAINGVARSSATKKIKVTDGSTNN